MTSVNQTIIIVRGHYNRKEVAGTFELVKPFREYSASNHKNGYAKTGLGFDGTVVIEMDGKAREVHVNKSELHLGDAPAQAVRQALNVEVDKDKLASKIFDRFKVLELSAEAVVSGLMRGLVISGAPGVGKTYTLEKRLIQAEDKGEIESFKHVKGKMTPLALYETLFQNSEEGQVLLLDDTDSVFEDPAALNLLKAALDTSSGFISYGSTCKYLEDNGIPKFFDFKGSIVFITNYDFDRLINSGSRMAPHFKALASRTTYLDLKIHTNLEIMIRVEQVANGGQVVSEDVVPASVMKEMVAWLWDNYTNMREVSIRTLIKMGEYHQMGDWKFLSENFMLLD